MSTRASDCSDLLAPPDGAAGFPDGSSILSASKAWIETRLEWEREGLGLSGIFFEDLRDGALSCSVGAAPKNSRSAITIELSAPPSVAENFIYYQPERDGPWARVRAEVEKEEDYFTHERKQRLEDSFDSILPLLRFRHEKRNLFLWLDSRLKSLIDERAKMRKESWTGIYLLAGNHLELGPFRGFKTEHHVIALERGLCGQAASTGQTVVADDVKSFGNYLACSPLTRSEIVVPLKFSNGKVWGELDLDSAQPSAYDSCDKAELEEWCEALSRQASSLFSV